MDSQATSFTGEASRFVAVVLLLLLYGLAGIPQAYCYSYGFTELGEYFISKGADDSVRNADGLTCYEGLDMDDVNNI